MKKRFVMMCMIVGICVANVCDEGGEVGTVVSGSSGISGATNCYFYNVVEDQERDLLYFIGGCSFSSYGWNYVVYKTDYSLRELKVMRYNTYFVYYSVTIDSNGDFIYLMDSSSNKIVEISTNLSITRELTITSAYFNYYCHIRMKNNLYFSFQQSSNMWACQWDTISTNLKCFTIGIYEYTSLAPINTDLLFFGIVAPGRNEYFLVNYNFSDPSNPIWRKSIQCSTSSCYGQYSTSLLSQNEESIFTMILYDNSFIFHKLSVTNGSPQSDGLIWNDNSHSYTYSMREFNGFIAVLIYSSTLANYKRLVLIGKETTDVIAEYKSMNSQSYAVGRLVHQGQELMFHCGRYQGNYTSFFARSLTNDINQLPEFEEDTPRFSRITSNYQISDTTSNPSLTVATKTLIISTSPSTTSTDVTASVSSSFTTKVALWNQDHIQNVQSDSLVQIDFIWACTLSGNLTEISFGLNQTGSNEIPEWVQIETGKQELYLNKTPKLTEEKTFYFSLKISFESEVHYKRFEITVEQCSISECEMCQLGNSTLCEKCKEGFQISASQKSCPKIQSPTGANEAATTLIAISMIMSSASSVLSFSSANSIFSMMNSLQLAMLLPLVPHYFSYKVLDFLSGMGFSMLSFDFIKLEDISLIKGIITWITSPQHNEHLENIGMRYASSIINYLSLMVVIILVGIIHLSILLCYKKFENSEKERHKKFIDKLFKFFTFNIYIRIYIQAFTFTTLAISSELYSCNFDSTTSTISFCLCMMFALSSSVLFILSFLMYKDSFSEIDVEDRCYCTEYFNGVRNTKYSKLYSSMFMTLRLLLIWLVIFGKSIDPLYKALAFCLINIGYGAYLLIVRPLENPQDNIIEIINQFLFCCLSIPLCWLNTKPDWSSFYEHFYTSILMTSPAIGSIICFIFLLKSITTYTNKKKSPPKITPITSLKTLGPHSKIPRPLPKSKNPPSNISIQLSAQKYASDLSLHHSEITSTVKISKIDRLRPQAVCFKLPRK
ncbi:unnamed protein product [Moneuplotes crassus]|uniref:Transmembrane protein n=1 Tax=Euplotes crassus TaxID=5936 RepID=A0AAD1XYU5_EUPCR|nr:unnamed protein product [Moneuplotes crassus]